MRKLLTLAAAVVFAACSGNPEPETGATSTGSTTEQGDSALVERNVPADEGADRPGEMTTRDTTLNDSTLTGQAGGTEPGAVTGEPSEAGVQGQDTLAIPPQEQSPQAGGDTTMMSDDTTGMAEDPSMAEDPGMADDPSMAEDTTMTHDTTMVHDSTMADSTKK